MPTRVGARGGQRRARGRGELAALHTRSGRGEPGPRPGPGWWPRAALSGVWTSVQGSGSHPQIQWAPLKGSPGAASSPFINHPSLETKSSLSRGQELKTHGPASHPHALWGGAACSRGLLAETRASPSRTQSHSGPLSGCHPPTPCSCGDQAPSFKAGVLGLRLQAGPRKPLPRSPGLAPHSGFQVIPARSEGNPKSPLIPG